MVKKILLVIVALIALVLIVAATRPDTFRVQRSAHINAPAEKIYPYLENFHQWAAWSPWEKLDPAMQRTYTGPESGVGSKYAWTGNSKVGAGSMELAAATAPTTLKINLTFLKPFESHSVADFTLVPDSTGTTVTWSMTGPMNYMSKIMCMFMSMDKMVGGDFEKGLANLKAVSEK